MYFSELSESMQDWYLSRRMFLIDTLSGREKSLSSVPKVIRVASSVKIRCTLLVVLFMWKTD